MIKYDLHTHTIYSDGNNTVEEMVLAAEKNGIDAIIVHGRTRDELKFLVFLTMNMLLCKLLFAYVKRKLKVT